MRRCSIHIRAVGAEFCFGWLPIGGLLYCAVRMREDSGRRFTRDGILIKVCSPGK